jgi:neutral ceramidase
MTRASCILGLRGFGVMLAIAIPAFALAAEAGKEPAKRVFRAGAATSNITPWLGDGIVGGWGVPQAKHIHDELHARCLVLDDGTTRLALVIADSVGIPREVFDEAKRQVHEATGLPLDRMLMAADHTHSATSSRPKNVLAPDKEFTDYQRFLAHRISDGVRRAINNLEPARIGWGTAEDPRHVFNRRWVMKPGANVPNPFGGQDRVKMNPGHLNPDLLKPSAPVDPQICFLSLQAADGRPIALLANYSLHYVGGVPSQHISGDYFAVFADRIQELLGADRLDPPFVGIMSNGTSGDVNNINYAAPPEKRKPYEKMRYVADEVAKKVIEQLKTVTYHDWVPLGMRQRELELAVRKPTPEMVARAKDMIAHPDRPDKLPHERTYAHRILQLEESPPTVQVILQSVRIGELGIAAIPFEVFVDTGLELKAKSPFKPSFTISLANGTYGYLPTPEQHKLGGYETWFGSNRVEEQASTKITQTLLEMFEELK